MPTGVIVAEVRTNLALGGTFGDDYDSDTRRLDFAAAVCDGAQ